MSEFRQNLATKEWIIIASERNQRPDDFAHTRPPVHERPANDPNCPFCAGHEDKTPPPVLTIPPDADQGKWDVRVVPNKFPALRPLDDSECRQCSTRVGPYVRRDGVGFHEVVVETPQHNHDIPLLAPRQMEEVIEAYSFRYNELIQYPFAELVVIFRNHGMRAGTSIMHPHSQIVASSVVPFPVRNRLYEGQRYFDTLGRCVYCDMLEYEQQEGTRVVLQNEHFLVFCPYASSVPYELLLLPRHHHATFGSMEPEESRDLARALQDVLARLWRLLEDPDYNYVIDTAPAHMAQVPFYHWHLEIYPKLTTPAGFEIGSGIHINVVEPERAAEELRKTSGERVTLAEVKRA